MFGESIYESYTKTRTEYRVSPNPAALRALGVGYDQLERALTQFGVNTGGGYTTNMRANI